MISGIALAAKQINPATKIIAVEPRGKELGPCLKAKQRLWSNPPQFIDTIAEGIKTQQVIHFLLLNRKRLNFALPMVLTIALPIALPMANPMTLLINGILCELFTKLRKTIYSRLVSSPFQYYAS